MRLTKTARPFGAVKETAMRSRSPAGPRRLGTATRMSASLSRRLSVFFVSTPGQGPKAAKFAVLPPGHAGFPKRVKRSEGSDSSPVRKVPVSACGPLCAIFLRKPSVYPLSLVKANVGHLCECDLKPLWRGFSLAIWDAPSAYLRQVGRLVEENRAPAEAQRSGFGGKRRRSGMSEFSPFSAETSGMELAVTNSSRLWVCQGIKLQFACIRGISEKGAKNQTLCGPDENDAARSIGSL